MDIENEVENDIQNYSEDNSYTADINLFNGIKESKKPSKRDERSVYDLYDAAMSYIN